MAELCIRGGRVLLPDGLSDVDLRLEAGRIAAFDGVGGRVFDARGLLVLPGIVDIHGDAFERQVQPRPGVDFPVDIALRDTEAQLLANGITTAFHGITLSWEPGLRSLPAWQALLAALAGQRWVCDMRVHLRWEAYNLAASDTALADIAAGRVHLLAFNDHTPSILRKLADPVAGAKYSERAAMTLADFSALARRIEAGAAEVPAALERLAAAARAAGLPMASHDDASIEARTGFRAMGARICEFPMAEAVGIAARQAGDWVVMGSPNVVRGRSHLGWAEAARLAEAGVCNILSSDYFYPAMLRAAFIMAGRGVLDLAQAWALVSANPAAAAGLADRGAIAPGLRGDLVLVAEEGGRPRLVATIAQGRIAHLGAEGWERWQARDDRCRAGRRAHVDHRSTRRLPMNGSRVMACLAAGPVLLLLGLSATFAQTGAPATVRSVRGTVETLDGNVLTVRTPEGTDAKVTLASGWGVRAVVPSSLAAIKPGTFIGTATVGPENHMVA
ncbi:MAG: alpha-D-ribose 1-methylphosphonate 5-triphosphate diphosphatase, partial [Acidisphaera sp.]|nr:alpha-D-ribose 1-methylphosphonate 5-triphosphate diphosphatase [Acidisphaera sp.]